MSAQTDDRDRRSIAELQQMDRDEARNLPHREFKRWESITDHLDRAAEQREEWAEDARVANDLIINADASDLATGVTVFGNDLAAYYSPDDPDVRNAAQRLGDILGVDGDTDPEARAEAINADDIAEEDIDAVKDALAELVLSAVVEWDGTDLQDAPDATREAIREQITQARPDGWGVAGLMDAWTEIQYAVESNRDERMERVRRFRDEERRGDRAADRQDGL